MARQSVASLAVVSPGTKRPDPPAGFTPAEAEVWRQVVQTKPGEWFTRDTHPLLTAYCRGTVASEVIAQQIERFEPEWLATADGLLRYDKLLAMQYRQGVLLANLATKMRMTQQSKYGARHAETQARAAAEGIKPWQRARIAKEA